jgi:hypothetical protein
MLIELHRIDLGHVIADKIKWIIPAEQKMILLHPDQSQWTIETLKILLHTTSGPTGRVNIHNEISFTHQIKLGSRKHNILICVPPKTTGTKDHGIQNR